MSVPRTESERLSFGEEPDASLPLGGGAESGTARKQDVSALSEYALSGTTLVTDAPPLGQSSHPPPALPSALLSMPAESERTIWVPGAADAHDDAHSARGAREQNANFERAELANDVLLMRKLSAIALPVWLAFALSDAGISLLLGVGSDPVFWGLRALGTLPMLFVLARLWRSPPTSRRGYLIYDLTVFSTAAVSVSGMCLEHGGLQSPYLPGVLMIVVARGAILASHWRRGLPLLLAPALTLPLTVLAATPFSPTLQRQFSDPRALASFGQHLAMLACAVVFLLWGSHLTWSLRRKVYETRSIGRYRLLRRIAKGGMGEVWSAIDSGLRRNVALKMLRPEENQARDAVRRFEQEVAATAQLTHPNTVRVFDYGVSDDGIWYYAMEYLEGVTLAELVAKEGRLAPQRALYIAHQVARALSEAHARGIYHRDIKPENIFLTSPGNEPDFVKVLDFGIAKLTRSAISLTHTGTLVGTPAFISPEVVCGRPADARTDVYALGAVVYFMLCGRPPFEGENAAQVLQAHVGKKPISLRLLIEPRIPEELVNIVDRCLEKNPEDRYGDAALLADAFKQCAGRIGSVLRGSVPPLAAHREERGGSQGNFPLSQKLQALIADKT
jgi:serine/threonine-protein kinase